MTGLYGWKSLGPLRKSGPNMHPLRGVCDAVRWRRALRVSPSLTPAPKALACFKASSGSLEKNLSHPVNPV